MKAAPEAVWTCLTEASELYRWFAPDVRITPGSGGSIWVRWTADAEGTARITAWQPDEYYQEWSEHRPDATLRIEWRLEADRDGTLVRVTHSGFGLSAEWNEEYDLANGGWSYFLQHLKCYLERHRGEARTLLVWRESVAIGRRDAFARLAGPAGLSSDNGLLTATVGAPFHTAAADGGPLSGTLVALVRESCQMGLVIAELNHALAFVEVEPDLPGSRPGLWLSIYGLPPGDIEAARRRFEQIYRHALEEKRTGR